MEHLPRDRTSFTNRRGQSGNIMMTNHNKKRKRKKTASMLKLSLNGETRSLPEWLTTFAELFYPHIGRRTYRVPPFHFNHQNVVQKSSPALRSMHDKSKENSEVDLDEDFPITDNETADVFDKDCKMKTNNGQLSSKRTMELDDESDSQECRSDVVMDIQHNADTQGLILDILNSDSTQEFDMDTLNLNKDVLNMYIQYSDSKECLNIASQNNDSKNGLTMDTQNNDSPKGLNMEVESNGNSKGSNMGIEDTKGQNIKAECNDSAEGSTNTEDTKGQNMKAECNGSAEGSTNTDDTQILNIEAENSVEDSKMGITNIEDTNSLSMDTQYSNVNNISYMDGQITENSILKNTASDGNEMKGVKLQNGNTKVKKGNSEHLLKTNPGTSATISNKQGKIRLLYPPADSVARHDTALSRVLDAFERLGHEFEQYSVDPVFVVSSVNYDNYLSRLPLREVTTFNVPRPQDVVKRGQLDVLVLHAQAGILLVQVKAVGSSLASWPTSDADIEDAIVRMVCRAVTQLDRDDKVFRHVLQDLDPPPQITKVVALPFVERQYLHKISSGANYSSWDSVLFLCQDDLQTFSSSCARGPKVKHIPLLPHHSGQPKFNPVGLHLDRSRMWSWWDKNLSTKPSRLGLDHQKTIVGRVCGLLSSLNVHPNSKSRVEVRTYGQAVSETAVCTTSLTLTPQQSQTLDREGRRVALVGPPGAGKSMILALKGRQWLEEGRLVVVVSIGKNKCGLPNAYALQEAINSGVDNGSRYRAKVLDLGLCQYDTDDVRGKIETSVNNVLAESSAGAIQQTVSTRCCKSSQGSEVPMETVAGYGPIAHFIIDDVCPCNPLVKCVLSIFNDLQSVHSLWCSTSAPLMRENALSEFLLIRLSAVSRCPPTVQTLLEKLEWRSPWKTVYVTSSLGSGLATDGPPCILIHHNHPPKLALDTADNAEITKTKTDIPLPKEHLTSDPCSSPLKQSSGKGKQSSPLVLQRDSSPQCASDSSHFYQTSQNLCVVAAKGSSLVDQELPLQCWECAREVAISIKNLIKDSEVPAFPILGTSRKAVNEIPKCSSPGKLDFKDIIILTALPQKQREGGFGRKCLAEEEHQLDWQTIKSSVFLLCLQSCGIPVLVVSHAEADSFSKSKHQNSVVLTDVLIARGLERKVVIFVPFQLKTNELQQSVAVRVPTENTSVQGFSQAADNVSYVNSHESYVNSPQESHVYKPRESLVNSLLQSHANNVLESHVNSPLNVTNPELSKRTGLQMSLGTCLQSSAVFSNLHKYGVTNPQLSDVVTPQESDETILQMSSLPKCQITKASGYKQEIQLLDERKPDFSITPINSHETARSPSSALLDCVDEVIAKLDDHNKKSLYRAASCCVSQLIVVVP